jgi:hypothetical protein
MALAALALGALTQAPSWVLAAAAAAAGALAPPLVAVARAPLAAGGRPRPRPNGPCPERAPDAGAVLGPAIAGGLAAATGPELGLACLGTGAPLGCLIAARLWAPAGRHGPRERSAGALGSAPWPPPVCRSEPRSARSTWPLRPRPPPTAAPSWPRCRWRRSRRGAPSPRCGSARAGRAGSARGRYVVGLSLLATVLLGCLFVRSLPSLSALLLLAGASYAALNVGLFELLDEVAPAGNAAESLAWITTAEESAWRRAPLRPARAPAGPRPRSSRWSPLRPSPGAAVGLARRRTLGPATPRRPTAARRSGP